MKWILILIISMSMYSCCHKIQDTFPGKDDFSEKEISFLANNCDYVNLICSERMVLLDQKGNYKYDAKVIAILEHTICFEGLTPSKLVSIMGKPSYTTDLLIGYYFRKENETKKFSLINFGIENGIVVGHALLIGHEVQN